MEKYKDKRLTCGACLKDWIWTADSQLFYAEHNLLKEDPTREPFSCPQCRIHNILLENIKKQEGK